MTFKDAQRHVRDLGLVLTKRDDEYRVNYRNGREEDAYYTNDLDDAVGTASMMARGRRNAAYSPKTGARCSCRPGVERDNCPRCEGTGWVIDFKKIRERFGPKENPARWAHGTMSYRQVPEAGQPLRNVLTRRKARLILHHKKVRGHPLTAAQRRFFGARASGYPMRRNAYRRNPAKGGGIGIGTIALLAGGAFLLMGGGRAFASVLGTGGAAAAVPPGYTPIGNGLYRAPNGTVVARNPQTGQMVAAPYGSQPTSAEDLLTRAGISLIPSVAGNLASWVSGLFTTQHTATTPVTESPALPSGGAAIGTSDVTRSGGYEAIPALPPLPSIFGAGSVTASTGTVPEGEQLFAPEGLPDLALYPINESPDGWLYDLGGDTQLAQIDWSQYELPALPATYDYADAWGSYDLPALPDVGLTVGGGDVSLYSPEAQDYWGSGDAWSGFMGFGRRPTPGFQEEARFLRRPPSYR